MSDHLRSSAAPSHERTVAALRDAAAHLVRDLQASLSGTWELQMHGDLVMTLTWGERSESVQLGDPLAEAGWLQDDGRPDADRLPAGVDRFLRITDAARARRRGRRHQDR